MDALSTIDMGTHVAEQVTPAKSAGKSDRQFVKVLSEKQQPEKRHVEKQAETVRKKQDKADAKQTETVHSSKSEEAVKQSDPCGVQPTVAAQGKAHEAEAKGDMTSGVETNVQSKDRLQHTLVDLLEFIGKGEAQESDASSDRIEALLTDLVQQLDSAELQGEQGLSGIDVSALVETLQSMNEGSDQAELLAQLVTQVEEQLTRENGLPGNAELTTVMMAEPEQQATVQTAPDTLGQARQILQKAIDAVVAQKTVGAEATDSVNQVAAEGQPTEETVFLTEDAAEGIDPRFAGLLKPRTENRSDQSTQTGQKAHLAAQENSPKQQSVSLDQGASEVPMFSEEGLDRSPSSETGQLAGGATRQVLENLVQQGQSNYQPAGQVQAQGMDMNRAMPQTPMVQLASGQQVAESQIFDQVVTHISGSVNGESGRMVLRLQPAELGSLKLELVVEGDRVRANLHAQSAQVQEVIERNLPQLRNALAEQGLKIDQFQVNIDQRQQGGQFENFAQQQQNNGSSQQPGWQHDAEPEEQVIPLAHLMQNGGGGISLHV